MEQNTNPTAESVTAPVSEFKGRTIQLIGWRLLGALISVVTFGICMPWAHCMVMRWETNHTYIDGKQLHFDGKGGQLFGRYLLWGLLTIVTIGIFGLFVPVKMRKWRAGHTRLATEAEKTPVPTTVAAAKAAPVSAPEAPTDTTSKGGIIAGFVIAGVLLLVLCGLLLLKVFTPGGNFPLNQGLIPYLLNKPTQDATPDWPVDENGGHFYIGDVEGDGHMQIIQNEDGSFTVIYGGDPDVQPDDTIGQDEPAANVPTDILGSWMSYSEDPLGLSVTTYTFHADGTYTTFSDSYEYGYDILDEVRRWQASGLADQQGGGSYRYENGQLYLYDIYYKIPPNETESREWELHYTDTTYDWQLTLSDDGETLYYWKDGEVSHKKILVHGSTCDMLDLLYPDGPLHDTI